MSRSRRTVLAACGAGIATLAGCSAVGNPSGGGYEQSDLELAIRLECAAGGDDVVATLSWEWAGGAGGAAPADVSVIHWPDEQWELVRADHGTTEAVRFDGKATVDGTEGVRFRHDDPTADGGTTYAASCALSPKGDSAAARRQVVGRFAHVREEATGTRDGGWFGDVDEEWTVERETARRTSPCRDDGS